MPIQEDDRFYKSFGKQLRYLRLSKKVTQSEIARAAGLSRQSVANIERGRQRFMAHSLIAFARGLDVQLSELLPPSDSKPEVALDVGDYELTAQAQAFLSAFFPPSRRK